MNVEHAITAIDSLLVLNATAVDMLRAQNQLSISKGSHNSGSSVSFASTLRNKSQNGPGLSVNYH